MKKAMLHTGILAILAATAAAQDVHFTQYFSSPLTLNPALTGLTQCGFRLAASYRSQWYSVSANPYITGSFSYDMSVLKGRLDNGDAVGIGVLGVFDRAGQGGLQNTTAGISVAYHKALGQDGQHTLSAGIQGVLVQKKLDFSRLTFNDQYVAGVAGQPTRESGLAADMTYPDFNAGVMYSGRLAANATGYAGCSYYHITRPAETFLGGSNKIHARFTGFIGSAVSIHEKTELYISGMYQHQGAADELVAGAALGFVLNPRQDQETGAQTMLYLGGWYRTGDAVSPYVSLEWSRIQIGVSYDAGISKFNPATNGNSAYEVSLIFNGCISQFKKDPKLSACPRF